MASKRSSGNFGVALTSSPSVDERMRLPSLNRTSINPDAYEHLIGSGRQSVGTGEVLGQRRAGDRRSMGGNGGANGAVGGYDDAGKRRSQYYDEQASYKNGANMAVTDKMQKMSPVVTELKTNVIVRLPCIQPHIRYARAYDVIDDYGCANAASTHTD